MKFTKTKMPWSEFQKILDQWFFFPFLENETSELRSVAIEEVLRSYGYTWDDVLNYICEENYEPHSLSNMVA